jgi:hypothetical protein
MVFVLRQNGLIVFLEKAAVAWKAKWGCVGALGRGAVFDDA